MAIDKKTREARGTIKKRSPRASFFLEMIEEQMFIDLKHNKKYNNRKAGTPVKERGRESIIKPMNGTWIEFQHHNKKEGKYWNPTCADFSAEQWREKVREMKEIGLDYLVLLATALDFECYFETNIFPKAKLACNNPIEALLQEADACDMKVFISAGFYGDWMKPEVNMIDKEVTRAGLLAMNQIAQQFGHHKSLYGWYFPDETCIEGYFSEDFIQYVNCYAKEAKTLNKDYKTLIAPYGTRLVKADDRYVNQLERLDADFIVYQDEIGVRKTKIEESAHFYENL